MMREPAPAHRGGDRGGAGGRARGQLLHLYTEAYSAPLRRLIAEQLEVPEALIHINAGSELILRQLFDRPGRRVHLLTPTYPLFPEVAGSYTETPLLPDRDLVLDLSTLHVPAGTELVVIVNPNNPTGRALDLSPLPALLARHPSTRFLVDEAFIELGGQSVPSLVPRHDNLLVTRTLSKAHSLAGFRIGYAILPRAGRGPERPQRRLPAGPAQPGGRDRDARARGEDPGARAHARGLDGGAGGGASRPGSGSAASSSSRSATRASAPDTWA